jgi:hypothetical protein
MEPHFLDLNRAFWQGYLKQATEISVENGRSDEGKFLKQLTTEFVPGRLAALAREPSLSKLLQMFSLFSLLGPSVSDTSMGIHDTKRTRIYQY